MREIFTLIGESLAKKGSRFIAIEKPEFCKFCNLFEVCMKNIVVGRSYEVIEVRNHWHYCKLYEGKLVVVKVLELPIELVLKKQIAMEGAIIKFSSIVCNEEKCKLKKFCKPNGLRIGERIKILKILEDVSEIALCSKNMVKTLVEIIE